MFIVETLPYNIKNLEVTVDVVIWTFDLVSYLSTLSFTCW